MNTPLPESACRVCIYLHKGECTHSHGPLNPSGDYCGGQVLTRKTQPAPKQEPFGYVSEHNCQGPFQFQFHKESATVYTDNCKSITPVYSTPVQAQERKPLTDEQAHQTLLDMAEHIESFGTTETTDQQLSAECIRFILERVTHSIKEQP